MTGGCGLSGSAVGHLSERKARRRLLRIGLPGALHLVSARKSSHPFLLEAHHRWGPQLRVWRVQLLPLLPLRPLLPLLLPLLMLLPLPLLFSAPCEGSQPLLLDERQLGLGRRHGASREGVGNGRFTRISSVSQAKIGKPGTEASAPQQHNTESLHGRWCVCSVQSEQPAERLFLAERGCSCWGSEKGSCPALYSF
jgi:hypothetical protein